MSRTARRWLDTQSNLIDPASVPGMQLRLDGQAVTGKVHGDPLTTWLDTSGQSRNAVTTGVGVVPKYINVATLPAGGNAGMAWYNPFDGAGSENGGTFPKTVDDDTLGFTLYFWLRSFDAAGLQVLFQDDTSARPQIFWCNGAAKIGWTDLGGVHSFASPTTGYHSLVFVFRPPKGAGLGEAWLDGVSIGSAVWNWNTVIPVSYIIGDNASSSANWDGWLAEAIVYSGAHSDTVRAAVQAYLAAKWTWG